MSVTVKHLEDWNPTWTDDQCYYRNKYEVIRMLGHIEPSLSVKDILIYTDTIGMIIQAGISLTTNPDVVEIMDYLSLVTRLHDGELDASRTTVKAIVMLYKTYPPSSVNLCVVQSALELLN